MELTNEERELLESFRRLSPENRRELVRQAASLASLQGEEQRQCQLEQRGKRPEAAKEPLFTE